MKERTSEKEPATLKDFTAHYPYFHEKTAYSMDFFKKHLADHFESNPEDANIPSDESEAFIVKFTQLILAARDRKLATILAFTLLDTPSTPTEMILPVSPRRNTY